MNIKKITFALSIVLTVFLFNTALAQNFVETDLLKKTDKKALNQWVDSVFNTMTLDQKIGQTIMAITYGDDTPARRKELLGYVKDQHVGGIIFLKGTPVAQANLTNFSQKESKIPLLIGIDGEWGLSMRLANTTRFPRNMMVGAIQEDSLIYYYGREVARQCRQMGIHVNFAPAIDVNSNPDNPVIGNRSYGENKKKVSEQGILYSKGLESGSVLSVGKHFPGHGDTSTDSHYTLPLINHDTARLDSVELYPFREYINAGLGGMLTAHLNIPSLDNSGIPSSLSKPIVTDLLQTQLGFTGLIFTDGLAMKGVLGQPDMAVKILQAGNDILLGPVSPQKEFDAIKKAVENGALSEDLINERCKKILTYKYLLNVDGAEINLENLDQRLNTSYAEWIARRMNQKAMTLLKNKDNILPLKNLDKRTIAAISIGNSGTNIFQETLGLYNGVTCFNVADASALPQLKAQLSKFNMVIVAVHANKNYNAEAIKNVLADKESVLVFFTVPYRMSGYAAAIEKADAVVMAYESSDFAQEYAAQAIYGGYGFEGKLPVTIGGLFKEGDGIETQKMRLSYNQSEEVAIPEYKLNAIATIVEEGIKEHAFPGCQVLVAKDGVIIYNRSFGTFEYNKKRKVTNNDIYDLASMTKGSATVPAIMKLYDDRKIKLQDPLSKYVKPLASTDKKNITVREALLHETGITSFIPYYMPAIDTDSYFGRIYSNQRTSVYNAQMDQNVWGRTDYKFKSKLISPSHIKGYDLQIADNLFANNAYKDTIVQAIADSKLRPSKKYLYSCLNFMLLKESVEDISGMSLDKYLEKSYFNKLGATTTTYNPLKRFEKQQIAPTEKDDFLRRQLLQGYVHDEGAAFMGGVSGNAGLFSNANDLAKLYQMWLNGGEYGGERYLSPETCKLFTQTKSARSRRGLGFDKPDVQNTKSNPCSPSTPIETYGHTGFTGTCFWIDPTNNLIYIFLSNRVNETRANKNLMSLNIRSRIQEEIYNALRAD